MTAKVNGKSSAAPAWQGKRVGRFRLVAELGRGSMGRVLRAEDTLLHRQVAIKVLPKVLRRGSKTIAVERLLAEARAAATLDHPHVVTVYEVNESGGVYYIAMELLEGGSLRDIVNAAGPMDYQRACLLCADAAEGLAAAHGMGIVHRDVKPANLMLTRGGRCKIADFGLARVEDAGDLSSSLPESVGTPQFIAPELLRGSTASAKSDIYSLGATLWFLIAGHPPFEAKSASELLLKHLEAPLPDLSALRPDLPSGLIQAINRSLAKQPSERFDSAQQFEKVLRVYTVAAENNTGNELSKLMSASEPAQEESSGQEPWSPAAPRPWFRRPAVLAGAGAGVLLAALLVPAFNAFRSPSSSSTSSGTNSQTNLVPAVSRHNTDVSNSPAPPTNTQDEAPVHPAVVQQPASPAPSVQTRFDLLANLDASAASVKGNWAKENGEIVSDSSGPAILEFPNAVPQEYDFRIEFTSQDCVEQLLFKPSNYRGPGTAFNWCMGSGELCGLESLNGTHVWEKASPVMKKWKLEPNVRHTSVVKVRKDLVRCYLDNELIVSWNTDYHDLSRVDDWSMRSNDKLGIGTWNKPTRFHKAELIDKTGTND